MDFWKSDLLSHKNSLVPISAYNMLLVSHICYLMHVFAAEKFCGLTNLTFKNPFFALSTTDLEKIDFWKSDLLTHKSFLLQMSALNSIYVTRNACFMHLLALESFCGPVNLTFKSHFFTYGLLLLMTTTSGFLKVRFTGPQKFSSANKCMQHAFRLMYMLFNAIICNRKLLWVNKSDFQKSIFSRSVVARAQKSKNGFLKVKFVEPQKLSAANKCIKYHVRDTKSILRALIGTREFLWLNKSDFQKSIFLLMSSCN